MAAQQATYLQYLGNPGGTQDCIEAIALLLQSPMGVREAMLLTHKRAGQNGGHHGFLLKRDVSGDVIIPPGFASGYGGEGPHGLSYVLALFKSFGIEVKEVLIGEQLYERLESMQLTTSDLASIENATRRRAAADYMEETDYLDAGNGRLWLDRLDPILPLALVAPPLADLAPGFAANSDHALLTGYRRLEDAVRAASGLTASSKKLMSAAFLGPNAPLEWPGIDSGEQEGRAQLFIGAYMAFRNRRAHREQTHRLTNDVREFLLLNLLFDLLESATPKEPQPKTPGDTPGGQRSSSAR